MPAPEGEGYEMGRYRNFKRFETVRYETGNARPGGGGKPMKKAEIENSNGLK